jgi:YD repeat-containing protein
MKNIKISFILMLLGFKLFAQIDFPQDVIAKNRIVKASKYLVISKKNPNYYKKPIGLMLQSESTFNIKGQLISTFSPNGADASHSTPKDLKHFYFYKDDKIVRMSRVDFDSISVEYLYFDKRNLISKTKTNDKNERIGLELIYNDANNGKELKKVDIDFHNTTELNNSLYIYKSNIIYSKNIKKSKDSRKLFSISKEQLNIFKTSIEIEKIENELSVIEKSSAIGVVNFETLFIYNGHKQLIKEVSEDNTIEYVYDKRGLLINIINKYKKYSFISKFIYSSKGL